MTPTPKTIQIFLPGGDPRGLRVAEITTRIVQVIEVPRTRLDEFSRMPESGQVGVYFLFGADESGADLQVYIGQTGDAVLGGTAAGFELFCLTTSNPFDRMWPAPADGQGMNPLLLKVYDQGGGWGLIARLFDSAGAPITNLVPQLGADPGWRPDQTDTDGDGIGDACE